MTAKRVAGLGMLWLGLAAAWHFSAAVPYLACILPLAAFAFMAYQFGRTLRAGSEPLISRIARKSNADFPPDVARYTRALTTVWAIAFATLFVVTIVLMVALPIESAMTWVNALGLVVPVALFAGEPVYRRHRLPNRIRESLPRQVRNAVAVFREIAAERP